METTKVLFFTNSPKHYPSLSRGRVKFMPLKISNGSPSLTSFLITSVFRKLIGSSLNSMILLNEKIRRSQWLNSAYACTLRDSRISVAFSSFISPELRLASVDWASLSILSTWCREHPLICFTKSLTIFTKFYSQVWSAIFWSI